MPTIEELLRSTLKGVNDQHSRADGDLHRAVAEVAKATQVLSGGLLTVRLYPAKSVAQSTRYVLRLHYRNEESRFIGFYVVAASGYPIRFYDSEYLANDVTYLPSAPTGQFDTPDEVNEHFRRIATDPSSPLVVYLAYAVRQLDEEAKDNTISSAG